MSGSTVAFTMPDVRQFHRSPRSRSLPLFRLEHLLAAHRFASLRINSHESPAQQAMRKFSSGWKRKTGVVTLMIARVYE